MLQEKERLKNPCYWGFKFKIFHFWNKQLESFGLSGISRCFIKVESLSDLCITIHLSLSMTLSLSLSLSLSLALSLYISRSLSLSLHMTFWKWLTGGNYFPVSTLMVVISVNLFFLSFFFSIWKVGYPHPPWQINASRSRPWAFPYPVRWHVD